MLTIQEIIIATKGALVQGSLSETINSVTINSRTVKKKGLYVAIKGKKHNGHKFIVSAKKCGASAIVVSENVRIKGINIIRVKDTTKALGEIALAYRLKFDIPVVGITGSAGKTSTKELLSSVLSTKYKVLKNDKTLNNQYGVPLTLLKLKSSHQIAVIEMGTNQKGDIAWLAKITRPTVAIFTNIGESHLEKLKTKSGVFAEKFKLIKYLSHSGVVIYNSDDIFLKRISQKKIRPNKVRFSIKTKSQNQAIVSPYKSQNKTSFTLKGKKYTINALGDHNIYNSLAAICCGHHFKISYNNINTILNNYKPCGSRQAMKRIGRNFVIDDTYNSNPVSFRSAIEVMDSVNSKGRRIVVCSDMLELGPQTKKLHQSMGVLLAGSKIDFCLTLGKHAKYISQQLRESNDSIQSSHYTTRSQLHRRLRSLCQPGDVLLVKGSRSTQMEKTVDFLKEHLN